MEYATELQPILAKNICPIHTFTITFSQQKEHTEVSSYVSGTDIKCRIFATYRDRDSKFMEELEQEFPVLEQELILDQGGFVRDGGQTYKATVTCPAI